MTPGAARFSKSIMAISQSLKSGVPSDAELSRLLRETGAVVNEKSKTILLNTLFDIRGRENRLATINIVARCFKSLTKPVPAEPERMADIDYDDFTEIDPTAVEVPTGEWR